jgi:predicted transposase YbfD/YdcC
MDHSIHSSSIMTFFSVLPDSRKSRNKLYSLYDLISTAILATLCSVDDYYGVSLWTEDNLEWLQSVGICKNGAPSHDTYERFFKHLDPKAFEASFIKWAQSLSKSFGGVIAIDGKTLCNSGSYEMDPIHIVSAFATENSLILGQLKCSGKGKEIETIQMLLNILDIKGAIITIDAAGCQKVIVKQIREKKGDYLIALKGNQGLLHDEVTNFFEQAVVVKPEEADCDYWCSEEKTRGRQEKREVWTTGSIDWIPQLKDWRDLQSIVCVRLTKIEKGKITRESRYYISSLLPDAEKQGRSVRGHWGIENKVHWHLDVSYNEDKSRVRAGNGAENLSVLRRATLNILKSDTRTKASIKNKRLKASRKKAYLLELMGVK